MRNIIKHEVEMTIENL